ncbi:MAG TPA: pyridoxamine 5'-phosphate oxidase family protein [Candidatus Limnocylindrales bacterium]|nr:pyridoxamine 5'-phosphate oxidase family protein [Candidatus Limnocylindrales bacterium]
MSEPEIRGWAADPDALEEFLGEPNLCRLGTVDEAGDPHVVPAWFWWDGRRFWLGVDATDRKVANVRRHGRAAVEVDGDIRRKRGVLAVGEALVLDGYDGRLEYIRISIEQLRRYRPEQPTRETAERMASRGEPVVIVVLPERIVSWGR